MDTIFAEATPPGRGGISVVRLSGPDAREIAEALAGDLPEPRHSYLRDIRDADGLIDQALVIRFDQGASFTAEPVVEFHLHGAPVISRRLQAALSSRGARLAFAGEFTQRAFLNGQIGLAQAEALADLLSAETAAQHEIAVRNAAGQLNRWAKDLRRDLIRAGALVEASLDFADEDVPEVVPDEAFDLVGKVRHTLQQQLEGFPAAERVRHGFEVAIVGPPNAGKSSLLNAIARRDVALVTDIPGTTRDVLELHTELSGQAVTFLDTAGLRDTTELVEGLGIALARTRAASADIRLHLSTDGTVEWELWKDGDIAVRTKADLGPGDVSVISGVGISELLDRLAVVLRNRVAGAGLIARTRQADAVRRAAESLDVVGCAPEVLAEGIRAATTALRELVGEVGSEDYLDEIFSSFCIGK